MGFAQPDPPIAQLRHPLRAHAEGGFGDEDLFGRIVFVDRAFVGLRQLHGAADDGGEHGLQIERGVHRAQHLLQRLEFGDRAGELRGAAPQLAECLRAADGDHRLFGKGLQQFHLLSRRIPPGVCVVLARWRRSARRRAATAPR